MISSDWARVQILEKGFAPRSADLYSDDIPERLSAGLTRTVIVLNKFGPSGHGEAKVEYLDGDFRVLSPGSYVRCAVTGEHIPLDELKYWSVDRQEAYATPDAVLQRHYPAMAKSLA